MREVIYQDTTYLVKIVKALKEGKNFEDAMSDKVINHPQWEALTFLYSPQEIMENEQIKSLLGGYKELGQDVIEILLSIGISSNWIAEVLVEKNNFKSLILSSYYRDKKCNLSAKTALWVNFVENDKYLEELYEAAMIIRENEGETLLEKRETHYANNVIAKIAGKHKRTF